MADPKQTKGDLPNQVIMDLGDFVPEEADVTFAINGRKFRVRWTEASVDEVFRLMLEEGTDDPKEVIPRRRRIVTRFLQGQLVEGDKEVLAASLTLVPFKSTRKALDIASLFDLIQSRVKKNDSGESPAEKPAPSGSSGRSRS